MTHEELRDAYRASCQAQYGAHPELQRTIFRPKPDGPKRNHIPTQFSATLIDWAGGYDQLIREWEPEP